MMSWCHVEIFAFITGFSFLIGGWQLKIVWALRRSVCPPSNGAPPLRLMAKLFQ